MKLKFTLLALVFTACMTARAAIIVVTVTNNQFTPANITNVQVGDVIRYSFAAGFHNAISTGIADATPAGAPPINSGAPSGTNPRIYDYTVTTPGLYKYACQVHADLAAYTGMVGQFTVEAVLPAVLKDFKVSLSPKNKASLSWKTVTELNVNYFSIKSSSNGIDFKEVGKVAAKGNSTTEQHYTYDDVSETASRFLYYMLVIVDKDSREAHSDIQLFKNNSGAAQLVTQLSPNPVSADGHLMFQFNAEKKGQLNARVFDVSGKMVLEQNMSAFAGLNNGHLHMGGLPTGTYSITFQLDGVNDTKKVVVK